MAGAIALVKQLRLDPLSKTGAPHEQRFIDMAGRVFDGIARMDESFYASLAKMVNEEPVLVAFLLRTRPLLTPSRGLISNGTVPTWWKCR